ncbi:MAG: methyltransferase domain-containing protein [Rhodospirillales bacterium]
MTAKPRWDPAQYERFSGHRLRPALDLLNAVNLAEPKAIADLGCGNGTVTALLRERWPGAAVTGIDSSAEMLERARAVDDVVTWQEGDVGAWCPAGEDLVFSNAALHWLDDHESLFTGLVDRLKPGSVLAVQMPDNFDQASHQALRDASDDEAWCDRLAPAAGRRPVASPEKYFQWLRPRVKSLDIWQTTYLQALHGPDAVFEWIKGAAMRPLLGLLSEDERGRFEDMCREALNAAYPPGDDGRTLFPFRRLFIVAVK